jgi:hypothetical protein
MMQIDDIAALIFYVLALILAGIWLWH